MVIVVTKLILSQLLFSIDIDIFVDRNDGVRRKRNFLVAYEIS